MLHFPVMEIMRIVIHFQYFHFDWKESFDGLQSYKK